MFDPTVFENLKVVLEGAVYDLDLAGAIKITGRQDLVDLAAMSRLYRLTFILNEPLDEKAGGSSTSFTKAEIVLSTETADLAAEILELDSPVPGCSLDISFHISEIPPGRAESVCSQVSAVLRRVWGDRFELRQTLSHQYGQSPSLYSNRVQLLFGRRFGEEVIEDIPDLLEHSLETLRELARWDA